MTAPDEEPFRLEDPAPAPRGGARNGPTGPEPLPVPRPPPPHAARRDPETGVDARTVRERQGTAIPVVAGAREAPPGWPREVLTFPFRGRVGLSTLGVTALVWAALDAIGSTPLLFLVLFLKVPLLLFLVRWFLHEVSMSAGGHDAPVGYEKILDLDREAIRTFRRMLLVLLLSMAPGGILVATGHGVLGVLALAVGSAWLSAAALGLAVGDARLLWPWVAAGWVGRRPVAFLAGAVGFWVEGVAEAIALEFGGLSFAIAFLAAVSLRVASTYAWLASARVLGVVGRTWTPWEEEAAPEGAERG